MKVLLASLTATLAMGLLAPAAQATDAPRPKQASIPFVNNDGIRDWRATDRQTLYVQDNRRKWYRATLFGPCLDLPFAQTIGFETRGTDTFDRFSTIVVRGDRCSLSSLEASEPPPKRQ